VDCEKFDRIVLDLLYGELDEITSAAARRHTEHCTRCKQILARLRATREVGALPLIEAPAGLEERILVAERKARKELPARQRLGRVVSVLAGYAMRPQLAMAALFLLFIGGSLLLLRTRPGEQKSMLVTERGVPEGEAEAVAVLPRRGAAPASPAPSREPVAPRAETASAPAREAVAQRGDERHADLIGRGSGAPSFAPLPRAGAAESLDSSGSSARAVDGDSAYEQALSAYRDRKYDEAERRFNEVASRGGENAASAALYSAQSARARSGCPTAAPLFDDVHRRFPDSQPGHEAAWQAAVCYRTLGDFERARQQYEALLTTPGYADRAQAGLASLGDAEPEVAAKRAPASAAASPKSTRPAAPAAPKAESP
jgi:TolA-binding protein